MIEALAKLAYEFHQRPIAAGTELWEWDDLPLEAREHWRKLVGSLLDYQTEHRKRPPPKPRRRPKRNRA